jgi:hypothetical protein
MQPAFACIPDVNTGVRREPEGVLHPDYCGEPEPEARIIGIHRAALPQWRACGTQKSTLFDLERDQALWRRKGGCAVYTESQSSRHCRTYARETVESYRSERGSRRAGPTQSTSTEQPMSHSTETILTSNEVKWHQEEQVRSRTKKGSAPLSASHAQTWMCTATLQPLPAARTRSVPRKARLQQTRPSVNQQHSAYTSSTVPKANPYSETDPTNTEVPLYCHAVKLNRTLTLPCVCGALKAGQNVHPNSRTKCTNGG